MNRNLIQHGLVLFLLASLGGLLLPSMALPRLGLSAHTIGLLGAILLMVLGAIWQSFELPPLAQRVHYWSWVYSSYVNWGACLFGALTGAGRMTPIAADGSVGADWAENLMAGLLVTVVLTVLTAVGLALAGLRGTRHPENL